MENRVQFELVVVGGGPAGFIAAISAARLGIHTALIEQYDCVGGHATSGLVAPISVFGFANVGRRIVGGIPWEFVERLIAIKGAQIEKPKYNISFDPEKYKLVAQRMLVEAGVTTYFNTRLVNAEVDDNYIRRIHAVGRGGMLIFDAKMFIDATGDAALAYESGVPMLTKLGDVQPCSLFFMLTGVDTTTSLLQDSIHHSGKEGLNAVNLPIRERMLADREREQLPNFGGPWFCATMNEGTILVNVTRIAVDPLDTLQYSKAAMSLREDAHSIHSYLKRTFPEFKDSSLCQSAAQIGIRESRQIKGVHVLDDRAFIKGVHFEDTIALASHPIDIHDARSDKQELTGLLQPGRIPFGTLVPEYLSNLLVAGRCISAEKNAFASLRVQATAMALGQAAGVGAVQVLRQECTVQNVDQTEIVNQLLKQGAILDFEI